MKSIGKYQFIKRLEKIYGKNKFDYSKLIYNGAHENITLICKKCKNQETKPPTVFYKGFGCLKCKGDNVGRKKFTTEHFVLKAKKIHGDKYNYTKSNYNDRNKTKLEIICPKHGSFYQTPDVHYGSGCPKCQTSKGEEEIAKYLNENKIKYEYQFKIKINNSNHYYDFYLPNNQLIIEYNGKQHYEPIDFFGGKDGFEYLNERDKIKKKYCKKNKIKLLIISYKDNINSILKENT